LLQPIEGDRALVERDADCGAGADHIECACAAEGRRELLVLELRRDGVRLRGNLGVDAERTERHFHRIGLAALELPIRRFELKREVIAGAHEGRQDVVVELTIDGAAIEFVALEGGLDFPRSDGVGLALLGGAAGRR
jgi:hypothetical protein